MPPAAMSRLVASAPVVAQRLPGLQVRCALLTGLTVQATRGDAEVGAEAAAALAEANRAAVAEVRAGRTLDGLREDPLFRAYRDFYWQLGIDPTKSRPSGEALNRRVLAGKELPRINTFVDAYNLVSVRTGVPIAAFDAGRLQGGVELRFGREGEPFTSIGLDKHEVLKGNELVMGDAEGVIAFYPHRDADRSKVTAATTEVLLVACGAPGVAQEALDAALLGACDLALRACGGKVAVTDA